MNVTWRHKIFWQPLLKLAGRMLIIALILAGISGISLGVVIAFLKSMGY